MRNVLEDILDGKSVDKKIYVEAIKNNKSSFNKTVQVFTNLNVLLEDKRWVEGLDDMGVSISPPTDLSIPLVISTALLISDKNFNFVYDMLLWWLYEDSPKIIELEDEKSVETIDLTHIDDFINYLYKYYENCSDS